MDVQYVDAAGSDAFSTLKIEADDDCHLQRPRESEKDSTFAPKSIDKQLFVLWCPKYFAITHESGNVVYENRAISAKSGRLVKAFTNLDQTMQILMFEDLSMHYIRDGFHQWTLEQSITKITKVEVFDKASLPKNDDEDTVMRRLSYLRHMDEELSFADVPGKIMRRYWENFQFFLHTIVSLLQNDDVASIMKDGSASIEGEMFGFTKTFILLTEPGKIVALSSMDGSVLWTYFDPQEKGLNVLVEATGGFDNIVDVIVVSGGALTYLDPLTGAIRQRHLHNGIGLENDFMLVNSVPQGKATGQVLMAVPRNIPDSDDEFSVRVFPAGVKLHGDQNLFYTQVNKQEGTMCGFQINRDTLEAQRIWSINFSAANSKEADKTGNDNHHIIEEVVTQYVSASGKSPTILPTIFGEEGVLLYKFFDANFFAVMVSKASNPGEVTFHVINSVSGHIVHQFTEHHVQRSNKSKVTAVLSENVLAVSF